MQALSKLSSYVCNKSFVIFPTVMNSLFVGVFSCERIAAQFPPLWRKILLHRGQRKVRLSEGRPILVTFHFFLVLLGATNVFSELIHPRLKLLNCVLTGAPKENMVQNHLNIALLNVFQYLNGRYRHTFIP